MVPREIKQLHKNSLLLLTILLFSLGLISDTSAKYLQLAGWPIIIYLMSRLRFWDALLTAFAVNLVLSFVGTFWIEYFGPGFIFKAVALSVWVLPVYCLLGRFLSQMHSFFRAHEVLPWVLGFMPIACFLSFSPLFQGFFTFPLPVLQILYWLPESGLTFLMLLTVTLSAGLVFSHKSILNRWVLITACGLAAGVSVLGVLRMNTPPQTEAVKKPVSLALVQHNYPFFAKSDDLKQVLVQTADEAALHKPDLIVFPLYNLPQSLHSDFLANEGGFFNDLAKRASSAILIGSDINEIAETKKFSHKYKVMAGLYDSSGVLSGLHTASEKSWFHAPDQLLSSRYGILENHRLGKLGVLISYEMERRDVAQKARKLDADLLVCISNPGDAPYSPLPYLQLRQVQMRAIETGLPVVTVTPNGFSGSIDRYGRIQSRSNLRKSQILEVSIP